MGPVRQGSWIKMDQFVVRLVESIVLDITKVRILSMILILYFVIKTVINKNLLETFFSLNFCFPNFT